MVARGRGTPNAHGVGALAALAIWAAGIALITGALAGANYRHYGVFRITDASAPGFLAANRALVSITHEEPLRFVPVPAEVRVRAYAASPSLAALRSHLEGPSWARSASCKIDKICDDFGAGYFRWILREAAFDAGGYDKPTALDDALMQIADEIDGACESGTLRCQNPLTSFLHPEAATYRSHLLGSLRRVSGRIAAAGELRDRRPPRDGPKLSDVTRQRFDQIANRRTELTRPAPAATSTDIAKYRVRDWLWAAHSAWVWVASAVGVAGLAALLALRRRAPLLDPQTAVIVAMAIVVAARVALLTVVDASSFPAWSSRYLYPVASLYTAAMLLIAHRAWQQWHARPKNSRGEELV